MARSSELADLFRTPSLVAQRHYEICRAYFLEQVSAEQLAQRFDLHADSVRAIVRDFAAQPDLQRFFVVNHPGRQTAPKREALTDQIVALRRQGLSLHAIHQRLLEQDLRISESYVYRILARHGLAERPPPRHRSTATGQRAGDGSEIQPPLMSVCVPSRRDGVSTALRLGCSFSCRCC